jgi:nucleoside 2-deoxyribosyltransferase
MNLQTPILVYLAAPLFSNAEKIYNAHARDLINQAGFDTYLPQEQAEDVRHRTMKDDTAIFMRHVQALDRARVVVAICDGPDADSGTSWEVGYAYAKGIPIIALRTDSRMIGIQRRVNLMIEQSSHIVTTLEDVLSQLSTLFPKESIPSNHGKGSL